VGVQLPPSGPFKGFIMKNPCEECLIQVNCSDECMVFKNYVTLLKNAITNFRGRYNDPKYKFYRDLKEEADDFSQQIFTRGLEKAMDDIFN
jgi:hypothetical protein